MEISERNIKEEIIEKKVDKPKPNKETKEETKSKTKSKSNGEKNFLFNKDELNKDLAMEGNKNFSETFELIDYINRGSCCAYYIAKLRKMPNKKIGLKFIFSKGSKKVSELETEYKIQSGLKHKYIIPLYSVYNFHDYSCIAMEYAPYGDLEHFKRNLVKRKYFSETFLCYLSHYILDALSYLHKNKIVHMDIKPKNVVVDDNLNIKLIDFSISQKYDQFDSDDIVSLPMAGTSYSISPEVLDNEPINVTDINKVDVYSFGILIYYLAFAKFPYKLNEVIGNDYRGISKKIHNEKYTIDESFHYSKKFCNFLERTLKIDKDQRFSIEEARNDEWVIKGSEILLDEKERYNNLGKYLISLLTDSIKEFNDFIKGE